MDTSMRAGATVPADPKTMLSSVPLDRSAVLGVAAAVLAPPAADSELPPQDCLQIAQLLAGHASLLADEVHRLLDQRPGNSQLRPLTETVLSEARSRLSVPPRATLASAQNRARLVRALYERLDRLTSTRPD